MKDFPDSFPRICCQCGREYGHAAVPNSHGYCPVCCPKILAEIKRRHTEKVRHFVRLCKELDWSCHYFEHFSEWYAHSKDAAEIQHLQKSLDIDARTHRIIEGALNKYSPWGKIRNKTGKKRQSL